MIRLRAVMPDGSPLEREFEEGSVLIGRSSRADFSLADRSLSREHARLYHSGDAWMVEDCGSRNGTFLNGQPVQQPSPLRDGDSLGLGSVVVSVSLGSAEVGGSPGFGEHTVLRPAAELLRDSGVSTAVSAPSDSASLRRLAERLHILNEVHQALAHSISLEELLEMILDRAFDHLKPEQGAIFLKEPGGGYHCAASRSLAGAGDRFVYSKSLIREVADKGMAALVLDTTADSRFNQAMSLLSVGVRSLIAAPLMDDRGAVGMMVLGSRVAVRAFREEDLELLVPLASVAAMRIRNIALLEEAAERRRLEEEIALARHIQVALLPDSLPDVPGYEIYGGNIPSRGVSGDYYEVVQRLNDRETVLLVADVSGKGIGAALLTASVEALSVAPIEDGKPVDEIFDRVSRQLYERTPPEKYATGFIAVLEAATGTLHYCNGGHCPALVLRGSDGIDWLGTTGPPLGLLPGSTYTAGTTVLGKGDVVVIYTDGITEANNPEEDEYGRDRLAATCSAHRHDSLDDLAKALEEDTDAFANGEPYGDDRTLVMLRRSS